ncbi:hypothetical protein TNIN_224431 [Trichonephila inaurata madagascariensis]|uniref:Uncharacterized protein n=1 Tax=Trichonephila inaurata madagascariensis TaxID=2747483 RepID=A0A8X6YT88_9ARAC|nr:hypothetical protein TNIN_224431 [Trichonephila inaurata madagascariensis]
MRSSYSLAFRSSLMAFLLSGVSTSFWTLNPGLSIPQLLLRLLVTLVYRYLPVPSILAVRAGHLEPFSNAPDWSPLGLRLFS